MSKGKAKKRRISPQRVAGLGCLVGLLLIAAFAVLLFQQIRGLFAPSQRPPGGSMVATQDVKVSRGTVSDGIWTYGMVNPAREAQLGFRTARGKVLTVPVRQGQTVQAGALLMQLDSSTLESDLAQARADLLEARQALGELSGSTGDVEKLKLEMNLRQARADLEKAQRDLAAYDAGSGTLQEKRGRAVADLANARAALAALRDNADRRQQIDYLQWIYNQAAVKHGEMAALPSPSEKDRDVTFLLRNDMLDKQEGLEGAKLRYEMDLRAAEHRVTVAERTLGASDREIALGGPQVERARRAATVRSAEAAVRQIEAEIVALGEGAADLELARAEAKVLKLEGTVADAEAALAEAKLVAPFAGVIDQLQVSANVLIGSSQPVVTVVDVSSIEIVASISDVDIARIKAGMEAQIRFDAMRSQGPFPGHLGDIPLFGTYQAGLTTFEVPVLFEAKDLPLRPGMGANIFIALEQKEDVLLVPATALQMDGQGMYVLLVKGKAIEHRRVKLGARDGINVEILEGLSEGDVVRVPLQSPMGPVRGGYG